MTKSLKNTTILGASLALLVAALGLLGYLPGLEVLGRVQENFIPMAPSTAVCFLLQGSILLRLAFYPWKRQRDTLILMVIAALTALFGLLEVPGHLTGLDLNFEDRLVPAAGKLEGIPIARMSALTGALFFLTGVAVFLLLLRSYSLKDRGAHGAGILGSLAFLGSFVATLGYMIGTPLLYGQGAIVPIALTTAIAFLWLTLAIITTAGQNSVPLQFIVGPSTRARLMRAFLPIATITILAESLAALYIPTLFPVNPVFIVAITVVSAMVILGTVVSWISASIGHDIDQAQEALRSSEERFSKAFHYDPDAISITSLENMKLVDVNEGFTQLTGFTRAEAIGKSTDELGLWANPAARAAILETVHNGRAIHDFETTFNAKTEEQRIVVISAAVIDMAGKPHIISVARDITERKKAEEALRQKDHEIRKAYVDVLSAVTDEKLLILTADELSAAQGEPRGSPYSVSSLEKLSDSRDFLRRTLKTSGISQEHLSSLILASGEAIVNGVKHAGTCEVQVYSLEGTIQIRISDNGPGIDFSDLPKATLLPGFSTEKSLGMGFTVLLDICDRVLLSTGPEGTTLLLESGGKKEQDTLDDILSRGLFRKAG